MPLAEDYIRDAIRYLQEIPDLEEVGKYAHGVFVQSIEEVIEGQVDLIFYRLIDYQSENPKNAEEIDSIIYFISEVPIDKIVHNRQSILKAVPMLYAVLGEMEPVEDPAQLPIVF